MSLTPFSYYTPYGLAVASVGPAPNGPGYTGHVNDPDTGLVYMQARYYDPAVGRFLSVDSVQPKAADVFGFNRYLYTKDNPINGIDPDGRAALFVTVGLTAVAGTGKYPFATVTHETTGDSFKVGGGVATIQVGIGVFHSSEKDTSAGGFATGQAAVTGLAPSGNTNLVAAVKVPSSKSNGVLGASVGKGLSIGITNAQSVVDLSGVAKVSQIDLGVISLQLSTSKAADGKSIWGESVGETAGLAASNYQTKTLTTP
ncbi:MAG: RHS repeat-associated core domain-containing protein [Rhodanobacter sp.]